MSIDAPALTGETTALRTISVEGATKRFDSSSGSTLALDDVNCVIEGGSIVSLIGPSGCGKSTLLRAIGGLHQLTSGNIKVGGTVIDGPRASTGLMLQRATLLPWRNVLQNIMLPLEVLGMDRKAGRERAMQLIARVGLTGFEEAYPRQLSGGMQQRASLCRLLASGPEVLLLDEPFGAVDEMTREKLQDELVNLWEEEQKTLVLVTHSISEAVFLSQEVIVMSARPGRITARIPIDLPRPREHSIRRSAEFNDYAVQVRAALEAQVQQ